MKFSGGAWQIHATVFVNLYKFSMLGTKPVLLELATSNTSNLDIFDRSYSILFRLIFQVVLVHMLHTYRCNSLINRFSKGHRKNRTI